MYEYIWAILARNMMFCSNVTKSKYLTKLRLEKKEGEYEEEKRVRKR